MRNYKKWAKNQLHDYERVLATEKARLENETPTERVATQKTIKEIEKIIRTLKEL